MVKRHIKLFRYYKEWIETYKKRMIFVKKVGFSKENTWFTGYLEILPTDPPIWKKKVEEMDYEYFTFQDFFNLEFGSCTLLEI